MENINPMASYHIYNKYITSIYKAKQAFSHYERYKKCFSIRSMDNEMSEIFAKLGLHYSKLISLVNSRKVSDSGSTGRDLVTIDGCEELMKEKASFFNNIICFLEKNKNGVLQALGASGNSEAIDKEITALETNLDHADKVVSRMDALIKTSQQIYVTKQAG
ncbi:hypothetical protein [Mucilaginibacter hurinus]|nr:hypothetical protein [Mucilaginibacter hurinus]